MTERWDVALRAKLERSLEAWGHIVARRPWPIIVTMLALAAVPGSQLVRLEIDASTESLLHDDDPARVVYDDFRRQFGREEAIVIALHPRQIFSFEFLEQLRALHAELEEQVPHVEDVSSLINARVTRGERDELIVHELLAEWPESERDLDLLRERALSNPLYRNLLISADGEHTAMIVRASAYSSAADEVDELGGFEAPSAAANGSVDPLFITGAETEEMARALLEIVDRHRGGGTEIHVAGGPIMAYRITGEMRRNMTLFTALAHAAIALLLCALFRRASAVALPLVVVSLSVVSTFGAMAISGTPLSIPTQILPSFLLAVGIGATVHLLVVFYQRYDAGRSKEESLVSALGHSGLAIVMTALTTAGGLVSFAVAEIVPVAALGVFAPVGIVVGLLYALVLLPALLVVSPLARRPKPEGMDARGWIQRTLQWLGDRSVQNAWTVVLCTAVALSISIAGMTRLSSTYDPLTWLPEEDPVRQATNLIGSRFGGTTSLEVIVDTHQENGLQDPRLLDGLDALGRMFEAGERHDGMPVSKTLSIADMTKEIHQALNANDADYYAIPESQDLVAQELLLFENSGSDDLEDVVDSSLAMARLTIKLPYAPPLLYEGFIARALALCEATLGDEVTITPTGFVTLMTRSLNAVTTSMLRSYVIALAIITPLMFLLLGSLRGGLIAMVPNLTPIIVTLGLMGWLGIPLDLFTLLIGSIAIGLAVDDTIHFMHNFRKHYERSEDVRRSVRDTLETTGHAMLVTSVVLSLSFFMFMLASLQNLVIFGSLTGLTIITAFLSDVTIAPALMAINAGGGRWRLEPMWRPLQEIRLGRFAPSLRR